MTEQEEQELLANVKSITDRMTIVDTILKRARMGENMSMVFQCGESGLYYPADYVRNWGKDWGDGLGPHPVSESLQTSYDVAPPEIDRYITSITQIMHPVRNCTAQVDMILVEDEHAAGNMAVAMKGDELMKVRAPILYSKQLANPASKIARLAGMSLTEAGWEVKRNGGFR